MKKIWLLSLLWICLLFTGCFEKDLLLDSECTLWETCEIQEPIVEEFNIENYINWFAWTILNWTEVNVFNITWDYTLYYNDRFWFAVILWEQWKWWKVELKTHNEQFGENAINRSIHFYKEWFEYDVYSLTINKIEKYDSMKKQDAFWTEDEFEKWIKWKNNKYLFMGYANDQLAPYIDTTDEYQQLFLNWFVFYDVDVQVKNTIKVCVHYFDWCNRCTMQDDWNYICTEEACEQHQQPYCDDYDMINLWNISKVVGNNLKKK